MPLLITCNSTFMIEFVSIALLTAIAEALCTWYIQNISANKPAKAAFLCALNMLVSKGITIESVKDNTLLIAIFIGAFIGVFIILKYFPEDKKMEAHT